MADINRIRERAERYFDEDARGDLDVEAWGLAMPPGDVLWLVDNYERMRKTARVDRRRLFDGTEPMVGLRVVTVASRADEWHLSHAHNDKVHIITSLLGNGSDGCGLVECGPTQFNVGMLRLAPAGSEVTCSHCRGWAEQRAKWREDAEVYRREQIGDVHRLKGEIERLREALKQVDRVLTCPAAEYVPAIAQAFDIIDAALGKESIHG